jgi:DNA-binding transcriptional regulator YiaG
MSEKKMVEETIDDDHNKSLGRHLGTAIRKLRLDHNLTIADVSERAGISRGMLSKIENHFIQTISKL